MKSSIQFLGPTYITFSTCPQNIRILYTGKGIRRSSCPTPASKESPTTEGRSLSIWISSRMEIQQPLWVVSMTTLMVMCPSLYWEVHSLAASPTKGSEFKASISKPFWILHTNTFRLDDISSTGKDLFSQLNFTTFQKIRQLQSYVYTVQLKKFKTLHTESFGSAGVVHMYTGQLHRSWVNPRIFSHQSPGMM